ncbi:hypothetical protein PVK06_019149 [Gossypium arboreum]|uniref:Uncharacterized protein n=1 Tax=Gossypium arboreum TaxID=29729 RepID=A0ABR0PIY9_GOSAR|nr:hypothetical protein PVK06_019149 [Gossypium arboreum]
MPPPPPRLSPDPQGSVDFRPEKRALAKSTLNKPVREVSSSLVYMFQNMFVKKNKNKIKEIYNKQKKKKRNLHLFKLQLFTDFVFLLFGSRSSRSITKCSFSFL